MRGEAAVHNNLAIANLRLSLHEAAEKQARVALEFYGRVGAPGDRARALDTLGQILNAQGHNGAAIECIAQALSPGENLRAPRERAAVMTNLAQSQASAGRYADARSTALSVLGLIDELGLGDSYEVSRTDIVELLASLPQES